MSKVTVQEVANSLREYAEFYGNDGMFQLAVRIEAHGIAPPDGMVLVQIPEGFQFNLELAEGALRKLSAIGPITPPEALQIMCVISGAKAMLAAAPEVKP